MKPEQKNTLSIEGQRYKLHQTCCQKSGKQKESGVKYIKC